jgi:hypothetical protein
VANLLAGHCAWCCVRASNWALCVVLCGAAVCSVPCVSDQARQAFSREFDVSGSASMNALWSGHKFACSPSGRATGLRGGKMCKIWAPSIGPLC